MKNNKNYKKVAMSSAVALGLAALPAVGVMAADGSQTTSITETISVTVTSTCGLYDTWESSTDNTSAIAKNFSKTMVNGELWNKENTGSVDNGAIYTVICNDAEGWSVSVTGAGTRVGAETKMASSNSAEDDIPMGLATSGPDANWAYKIASITGGAQMASGLAVDTYMTASNGDTVVKSDGATDAATTFTTGYQVYIGTETPAGTYTGKVTYTLAHPATVLGGDETPTENGESTEGGGTEQGEGGGTQNGEGGGTEQGEGGGTEQGEGGGTVNGGTETGGTVENNEPIVNQAPSRQMMAMAPSNYSGGTGGDVATVGGNSKDEKGDAQGVSSASGKVKSAGNSTVKSTAVAGDTGADNTPLIAALCATAAAGAAAAGVYLYNKEKEEE